MPRLSDTMEEGTVATWLKKVGDDVNEGDILAEIETDKATMEFESFQSGNLLYIGIKEGESAKVDALLAIIGPKGTDVSDISKNFKAGGSSSSEEKKEEKKVEEKPKEEKAEEPSSATSEKSLSSNSDSSRVFVSPLAKKIAEEKGINLSQVQGSGENGSNLNFKNAFGTMVQIKGTKQGGGGLADEGLIEIRTAVNGTLTGGVKIAAGATSWSSISDERLKDIIEPITNAAEKVSTLRAVIGNYKTDPKKTRRPFLIAQDIQAVLPEAVDDTDENELSLRYTETIPLLVAAIQEQQAIIESLTTRLETLENA